MGLRSSATHDLYEARELARKARQQQYQGLRPLTERHKELQANKLAQARDKTFKECAEDYFNFHKEKWTAKWPAARACPLSRSLLGVKRTCRFALHMSAFDPKWTSRGPLTSLT
jgi:hypothetical protein